MNKRIVARVLALFVITAFVMTGCVDPQTTTASTTSATQSSSASDGNADPSATGDFSDLSGDISEPYDVTGSTDTDVSGSGDETSDVSGMTDVSGETDDSGETTGIPGESTDVSADPSSSETTDPIAWEPKTEPEKSGKTPDHVKPSVGDEDYVAQMENLRSQIIDNTDYYNTLDNSCKETWCFQRKKDHTPSGSYENFDISEYNGAYINKNVSEYDKVIYLTFDCGYPSDNTPKILDILAAHDAKASFFVTKMYLKECSDYASRMKEEGHMVCNHTVSHADLLEMSVEQIAGEIIDVAEYFYEQTGYTLDPYFRTPKGSYSKKLMTIISDCGYKTVFWSIAYNDYSDVQPEPGYVTDHFATYHHNGAIALMHNDSSANVNELDAVLTLLEDQGYRFGLLDELG